MATRAFILWNKRTEPQSEQQIDDFVENHLFANDPVVLVRSHESPFTGLDSNQAKMDLMMWMQELEADVPTQLSADEQSKLVGKALQQMYGEWGEKLATPRDKS